MAAAAVNKPQLKGKQFIFNDKKKSISTYSQLSHSLETMHKIVRSQKI